MASRRTHTCRPVALAGRGDRLAGQRPHRPADESIQLGPRPFYLVDDMDDGPLKTELQHCTEARSSGPTSRSAIAARRCSSPSTPRNPTTAAARMGAGIIECDVTFTKDRQARLPPLAVRPAHHHQHPRHPRARGQVHAALHAGRSGDRHARPRPSAAPATSRSPSSRRCAARWTRSTRTPRPSRSTWAARRLPHRPLRRTCGTLLTHAESIELFEALGAKFTPELKAPERADAVRGRLHAGEVRAADDRRVQGGAASTPSDVFAQSFNLNDVLYWLENEPAFGKQAVYLDDRVDTPGASTPTSRTGRRHGRARRRRA